MTLPALTPAVAKTPPTSPNLSETLTKTVNSLDTLDWQALLWQGLWQLVHVTLIIVGVLLLLWVWKRSSRKLVSLLLAATPDAEGEKKIATLSQLVQSTVSVLLIATGGLLVLEKLGVNIAPLLATAGVLGLAIGFGAQHFVEDIINGLVILATDQIRVGDVVAIAGQNGTVEQVNLKMVVLRDMQGHVHFIRNGKIDIVTNRTKDYAYCLLDVGVAYKEEPQRVMQLMQAVEADLRDEEPYASWMLEPMELLGLERFEESAVVLRARIKALPQQQWALARIFKERLKTLFDAEGVEIPFPHRTLLVQHSGVESPLNRPVSPVQTLPPSATPPEEDA